MRNILLEEAAKEFDVAGLDPAALRDQESAFHFLTGLKRPNRRIQTPESPDQRTRSACSYGVPFGAIKTGKGNPLDTSKARALSGKKPYEGNPKACRAGGIDYNYRSPDPYGVQYFKGIGT